MSDSTDVDSGAGRTMDDPGLTPISFGNTAFEGLNNAYLLEGPVTTLVDTGVAVPETRADMKDGLAAAGYEFEDIDQILLTHFHADHSGLAGEIQEASGAVVRAHPNDLPLVEQQPDAVQGLLDAQRACFEAWGMPEDSQEELLGFLGAEPEIYGTPPDVTPFAAGDRFEAGVTELEVVDLPGHTDGLVGFVFDRDDGVYAGRELFSGDALLPYYTPNVGGADVRVERPLEKYLETLLGIVEADYSRAWPGHRGPIIDPTGRAADIAIHHRERTERVLSVLHEHGPCDTWTVSDHLFGALHSIHILHGPGEASAHLDHLERAGVVEETPEGYVVADHDENIDDLFPDVPGGDERPDPSA